MPNTKKYVSLDKLGLYDEKIKKYLGDADGVVLQGAKDYADGLAVNYEKAGAAATALADAKAYADGKDAAIQAAQKAGDDAATAAAVADGKAVQAQNEVDALEGVVAELDAYVGDIPEGYTEETVIAYINKKAEETLNAASGGSSESAASVLAALNTYKADNDAKVNKNTEDIATAQARADEAMEHSEGVAGDLASAVEALEGADEAQVERIAALEGQIVGLSGAMHFEGIVEVDPAIITEGYENGDVVVYGEKEYVWNNGAFVEFGDVSAEGERIATLEGKMTTAEGEIDGLQGDVEALEGAVALKADKTYVDEAVETLEGADEALSGRIATLEGKFGGAEGSVEDQIADAKQEAIDAAATAADTKDAAILAEAKKYADDEDAKIETRVDALETASGTHALAADLTALAGRVETAEGEIDTLQSEMDAVEALAAANKSAHEANAAAIALKADATALTAVSDRVTALETWHNNFTEASEEEINGLFA